jgi:hypothetical protein
VRPGSCASQVYSAGVGALARAVMTQGIKDKVVVITGASSFVGMTPKFFDGLCGTIDESHS